MDIFFYVFAAIALVALFLLVSLLNNQKQILKKLSELNALNTPRPSDTPLQEGKIVEAINNIKFPEQQKIEFPEFPKIEIPPAKEVIVDMNPVIEAINNIKFPEPAAPAEEEKKAALDTELLKEIATLMRVNQAEFQSGLEAFHKAIDKLLAQIPNGEKELNAQKEFIQKFEEALVNVEQKTAEAMNENSLRLQEILTEFLNVQK